MKAQNLLFIFSDEHRRDTSGCYGDSFAQTPNIDRLAARGARFTNAYCNSPICVPARAALATGRYVHEIGAWDNAHPYHGTPPAWGHELIDAGHEVVVAGKLHYRSSEDSNGFSKEIDTLHVLGGEGDITHCVRNPPAPRKNADKMARESGPGQSPYCLYDTATADNTCAWLREAAAGGAGDKPWVMMASFVLPHFPFVVPQPYFDRFINDPALPMPRLRGGEPDHPVLKQMRDAMGQDAHFTEERVRAAVAAYYGMIAYLDDEIGKLLATLEETGLAANTRIIYSSDHGENLGARGFWGKSLMYEEAAAIPLIVAGEGIAPGTVVDTPVTLVDMYPTIMQCVGEAALTPEGLPGQSLLEIANQPTADRTAFSEYHASASPTGFFMVRFGRWKYVYYAGGHRPQLFDLESDPGETRDLAASEADRAAHAEVLRECQARLEAICDPEEVNARCFADQAALLERHGGREAVLARPPLGHTPAPEWAEKSAVGEG